MDLGEELGVYGAEASVGTLPFKIATWSLAGALLTATLLRSFGPAAWGIVFTGSVIVMVAMWFIWWRKG